MFGIIIDKNGYKERFVYLDEETNIMDDELQENEQLITADWSIANSMNQPRWTGTEWVDENPLPEPELVVPEPTQQDILNAQLLKDSAESKLELQQQKQLNSQLLLEIAKLKVGESNV